MGIVGRRGKCLLPEGQQNLDQSRGSGAGEEMAHIALYRAQDALALFPVSSLPELLQALELHGVSHGSACGVAFYEVHLLWRPACVLIGAPHGAELPFGARGQEASVNVI